MAKRSFQVMVESIETLTPTVKVFRLRLSPGAGFEFVAGQYVMVDIPKAHEVIQKAYSIASPPTQEGSIDLCIKRVEGGYVSTYFHSSVGVGDALTIYEAQGTFVDRGVDRERVYVATGTGIAPIRSMIHALHREGVRGPMRLFFGVRYEDEILYADEWRRLQAEQPA
ncbi:MAG: FAD-binding oxidoreductase, partial [Nitrospiria bacterium]